MCNSHHCVPLPFSPSFSKLEEWLDNLLMHLDISLPLLSELEQVCRAFWKIHNQQNNTPDPRKTLMPPGQQSPRSECSNNANSRTEPGDFTRSRGQESSLDGSLNGVKNIHDDGRKDAIVSSSRSTSPDSGKTEGESYEHCDFTDQPKSSEPPQVKNSLLARSSRPRGTCKVLWDRSTEDDSFL